MGAYDGGGNNFTDATLTNADLPCADVSTDTLASVVSGGITGAPAALPATWVLVGGFLSNFSVLPRVHVGDRVDGSLSITVTGFGTGPGGFGATVLTNPLAPGGVATLQETGFSCVGGAPSSLGGNTCSGPECRTTGCTLQTEVGGWSNAHGTGTLSGAISGGGEIVPVTSIVIGFVIEVTTGNPSTGYSLVVVN